MRKASRGSALITALAVFLVVLSVGTGLLSLSLQAARRGRLDLLRTRAFALAEAGVEKAIFYLRTTAPDGSTDGTWRTIGHTEVLAGYGEFTLVIENGAGDDSSKVIITSYARAAETSASATARGRSFLDESWSETAVAGFAGFAVFSAAPAALPEVRRALRVAVVVEREDVGVWNNAIFGGVGQSGKSINGNVVVRGKMHLLGDGETFTDTDSDGRWDDNEPYTDSNKNGVYDLGEPYSDLDGDGRRDAREPFNDVNGSGVRDPALTMTDLSSETSGNANIGNNYSGMSVDMQSLLPPIYQVSHRGERVESLKAKLRAKHGRVNVSGSATVGNPHLSGGSPAVKETMDGVYVTDGFGGTAGSSQVYADNGVKTKYDLHNHVRFPTLTEATTQNGVHYASYMDYLGTVGLRIPSSITLTPGTAYGPVSDGRGNYLAVDTAGNITLQGIVYVEGDLRIARNGGSKTMRYNGRGTLVSTGSTYVSSDLIPAGPLFPVHHALGIVARRRLELATQGGDSQLKLAGAFYAQEQVVSAKQNEIAGSFVTSYFSMQNVPHMYQVPSLPDYLPPGMPGAGQIWVKTIRLDSWQEIDPNPAALP